MLVRYSKKFTKFYNKTPQKIKKTFENRLILFFQNSFHPLLHNHPLIGEYKGYRSINITGDWRAVYSVKNGIIIFEALGTHS